MKKEEPSINSCEGTPSSHEGDHRFIVPTGTYRTAQIEKPALSDFMSL